MNYVSVISVVFAGIFILAGTILVLTFGHDISYTEELFLQFHAITELARNTGDRKSLVDAFQKLRSTIDYIEMEWTIPEDFSSFVDAGDLSDFKDNLRTRLLPSEKEIKAVLRF